MYIHMNTYMYIRTHQYIYIYIYMCVCAHIRMGQNVWEDVIICQTMFPYVEVCEHT